ncbi:M14 family zinc carboxypeptidase [Gaopeijia maritima]|uniref:M14 family zinc carboxypeptidase n=1 Tax=Gaopeijia maritima TaxID=3119007 RepID=UPI0032477ECC
MSAPTIAGGTLVRARKALSVSAILRPLPLLVAAALCISPAPTRAQANGNGNGNGAIPTPEEYFGFAMGTSKKLARWDTIVTYFDLIAERSDRVMVDRIGSTTLGNPYLMITMSSPSNLAQLDDIRAASKTLAEGRVSRAEAEALADELPATVVINHDMHSTEVASSQTSVELVYQLATATDDDVQQILDEVVTVLIPSANPDGQIMVGDWYRQIVDTEFDEARMPYLYHSYSGHDNNRDYFQANLVETRHWMEVMWRTAYPQVYLDQHQMGGTGPRMFVPPYPDPMDPDIHPLQWQSLQFMGGGIVADLQRAGKKGVITGQMYRIWGQEGALTGRHHNIVALLTESASANLASPMDVTREQLEGRDDSYGFTMNFVDPWWGGEWTLGDIVDYQMIAAMSVLRQTARFRDQYVMGRWQMASETIARAEAEGPWGWVVPADQADPVAAADMARRLELQGIEVWQVTESFTATPVDPGLRPQNGDPRDLGIWSGDIDPDAESDDEGEGDSAQAGDENDSGDSEDRDAEDPDEDSDADAEGDAGDADSAESRLLEPREIPAGSWVILAAQPGWAAVEDLMMPQGRELLYEYPDGPFMRSYDGAAYTMPMQMGVEALMLDEAADVELVAPSFEPAPVTLPSAREWFAMSTAISQAYHVANRLMAEGVPVSRTDAYFLVDAGHAEAPALLSALAEETGVPVTADPSGLGAIEPMTLSRVGLYQGWAGSMDEGWTRLLLEEYGFAPVTLANEDVRDPNLSDRLDVVIIPSEISLDRLIDGADEEDAPEGYRGGIGEEGVDNLRAFVRAGGTLVTLERADALVLEHFDVPVKNSLEGLSGSEFFTPTSLYRTELDTEHPLAAGSPAEVAAKWAGGRAYEPTGWDGEAGRIRTVGRWATDPDRLLMSGLIVGEEHLAGKANILDVEYGDGHIYMYGFRVQHRAQTTGTFKLLFNALMKAGRRPMMD